MKTKRYITAYQLVALLFTILMVGLWGCKKDAESAVTGKSGSMARFTIRDNYLYTVDGAQLHTFRIGRSVPVEYLQAQFLGFGIETIFPTENYLFMGAMNGMHIYGLTDPSFPNKISFTPHFISYDPVVVQGDYAYVTLRSGEGSWSGRNQLLIFDVSKPVNPQLVTEYDMVQPRGLGIDGQQLFICDDKLKVFEVNNHTQISLQHSFNIPAIDVIPDNNHLYVVASDGLYQYSYNGDSMHFISKLTMPFGTQDTNSVKKIPVR